MLISLGVRFPKRRHRERDLAHSLNTALLTPWMKYSLSLESCWLQCRTRRGRTLRWFHNFAGLSQRSARQRTLELHCSKAFPMHESEGMRDLSNTCFRCKRSRNSRGQLIENGLGTTTLLVECSYWYIPW